MEKKTERVLKPEEALYQVVSVELVKGVFWDAYILPLGQLVNLVDGSLDDIAYGAQSVSVALTGGNYVDA